MTTTKAAHIPKHDPYRVVIGPGLKLILNANEIYPEDPGQGTPCLVELEGGETGTFHCLAAEGETVDGLKLTEEQCAWLSSVELGVDVWLATMTRERRKTEGVQGTPDTQAVLKAACDLIPGASFEYPGYVSFRGLAFGDASGVDYGWNEEVNTEKAGAGRGPGLSATVEEVRAWIVATAAAERGGDK